ncbi:MAG: glycosyltransferase family 2 protein [Ilumatobacteraceae bacterium]
MESEVALAPPVVALVVVHDPGVWFDESVAALAAQDYPNLRLVFLVTGHSDEAVAARISDTVQRLAPDAFVTELDDNPGFGAAANQVQELVEGDNGFFLLCHDDIAPDRDAVTRLVEELYRSNAGIVGPKLVEWDAPAVLQHVGLGLDRFGEVDPIIEPEEVDQEQHDGVRDVFAVPTACMLVRADLFRTLGGFDPAVEFHGDDVDLCWRAHYSGARAVVVPAARVRHREALEQRRPDLNHRVLRARHRMRSVATLTGIGRLPLRSIELVFVTFAEMIVGLFTGRFQEAWASMRALIGLIPRTPALLARRLRVASLRSVPEPEVMELQVRGSSRLSSYLRARDTMTYVGADSSVRRWRPTGTAPTIAWVVVIAVIAFGSRQFVTSGVPGVGEFLPFPDSAGDLLAGFRSGWNPDGFGASSPNPTGWGIISLLSVGTAFQMGLAHTVAVVGLLVAGLVGAGRAGSGVPLDAGATGQLHRLRRAAARLWNARHGALVGARRLRRRAVVRPPRPPRRRRRHRRPPPRCHRSRRRPSRHVTTRPGASVRLPRSARRRRRCVRTGRRVVARRRRRRAGRSDGARRRVGAHCGLDARRQPRHGRARHRAQPAVVGYVDVGHDDPGRDGGAAGSWSPRRDHVRACGRLARRARRGALPAARCGSRARLCVAPDVGDQGGDADGGLRRARRARRPGHDRWTPS